MSAIFLSASNVSVPTCENRVAGAGFSSALIKYVVAWVATSAEEIPVIVVLSGNNSTVYALRSALVLEV